VEECTLVFIYAILLPYLNILLFYINLCMCRNCYFDLLCNLLTSPFNLETLISFKKWDILSIDVHLHFFLFFDHFVIVHAWKRWYYYFQVQNVILPSFSVVSYKRTKSLKIAQHFLQFFTVFSLRMCRSGYVYELRSKF